MHNHHHSLRHSIHLGNAWEPPAPAEAEGRLIWTRRFGRPGGLETGDRVLLVVAKPACAVELVVNAVGLPPLAAGVDRWAQDITPLLRARNELRVTADAGVGTGACDERSGRGPLPSVIGAVSLEIVAAAGVVMRVADA
jgi:hypothetical protein